MAKKWKHNRCVTKKLWSFNLNFPTCCTTHRAFWVAKQEHRLLCVKTGLIFFNGEKIKITFANWKIEFSTEIACCKTNLEIPLIFWIIYLSCAGHIISSNSLHFLTFDSFFWGKSLNNGYPLPFENLLNLYVPFAHQFIHGSRWWKAILKPICFNTVRNEFQKKLKSLRPNLYLLNFLHIILRQYLRIWKAENWVISFQVGNLNAIFDLLC